MSRHRRQSLKRRRKGAGSDFRQWPQIFFDKKPSRTGPIPPGTKNEPMLMIGVGIIAQPWKCKCGRTHPPNRHRCKQCRQLSPAREEQRRRILFDMPYTVVGKDVFE